MTTTEHCQACQDPLFIEVTSDEVEGEANTVPDDLLLPCGCHFHWQCLLDQAAEVAMSLKCPKCETYLPTNEPGSYRTRTDALFVVRSGGNIITRYSNEGGVEEDLDILPTITEEAFFASYPEARPARALHLMAAEGDVSDMVSLLRDMDDPEREQEEPQLNAKQLLLWKDPLNGGMSLLHVAIKHKHMDVFWLMLWMSSALPTRRFPPEAVQAAQGLGLQRPSITSIEEDIRFIGDSEDRKPQEYCMHNDTAWTDLVEKDVFSVEQAE